MLTIPAGAGPGQPAAARPAGTVLVAGGTGMLGGLTARHLVLTGRAAGCVLVSRSGPAAAGVPALAAAWLVQVRGGVLAADLAQPAWRRRWPRRRARAGGWR